MSDKETTSLRAEAKQSSKANKEALDRHVADAPRDDKKKETGGPKGPEPTRYGDWEIGGKCVDF